MLKAISFCPYLLSSTVSIFFKDHSFLRSDTCKRLVGCPDRVCSLGAEHCRTRAPLSSHRLQSKQVLLLLSNRKAPRSLHIRYMLQHRVKHILGGHVNMLHQRPPKASQARSTCIQTFSVGILSMYLLFCLLATVQPNFFLLGKRVSLSNTD